MTINEKIEETKCKIQNLLPDFYECIEPLEKYKNDSNILLVKTMLSFNENYKQLFDQFLFTCNITNLTKKNEKVLFALFKQLLIYIKEHDK